LLPGQSLPSQQQQNRSPQQQPQAFSGTINLGNLAGFSSLLQGLTGGQTINLGQQGNQQFAQQQPQQQNMMGGLNIGGLMSMLGGMGMNPLQQMQQTQPAQSTQQSTQQSSQQPQTSTQPTTNQQTSQISPQQQTQQVPHVHGPGCNHHHPPQQQQPPQQFPQFDINNLASMASMLFNPQQQQPQSQQSSTQPQQQQNPMGGLMGMFSSLQQSGGMGELLNTSLGETL
jgi:hypothetical protein